MAGERRPPEQGQARGVPSHPLVKALASDPTKPPKRSTKLFGYPGPSAESGTTRLYGDLELTSYVDVPNAAILHSQTLPNDQGTVLWVESDATLTYSTAPQSHEVQAEFLGGSIAEGHLEGAAAMGGGVVGLPVTQGPICGPVTIVNGCAPSHTPPCVVTHAPPCVVTQTPPCNVTHTPPCNVTHTPPCVVTHVPPCGVTHTPPCAPTHLTPCPTQHVSVEIVCPTHQVSVCTVCPTHQVSVCVICPTRQASVCTICPTHQASVCVICPTQSAACPTHVCPSQAVPCPSHVCPSVAVPCQSIPACPSAICPQSIGCGPGPGPITPAG